MALTNAYCTLEELRTDLGVSDSADDVALERAINAASRQIDNFCGQRFWADATAVAREFYVTDNGLDLDLDQQDVIGISSATGLIVKTDSAGTGSYATTLAANTDFLLMPRNAALATPAMPYTSLSLGLSGSNTYYLPRSFGRPAVQVTAKWGWPAVPADVVQACLLQAAQLFKAKDAVFGVAAFGDFGPLRVQSGLNPIAAGILSQYPYQRPAVG